MTAKKVVPLLWCPKLPKLQSGIIRIPLPALVYTSFIIPMLPCDQFTRKITICLVQSRYPRSPAAQEMKSMDIHEVGVFPSRVHSHLHLMVHNCFDDRYPHGYCLHLWKREEFHMASSHSAPKMQPVTVAITIVPNKW